MTADMIWQIIIASQTDDLASNQLDDYLEELGLQHQRVDDRRASYRPWKEGETYKWFRSQMNIGMGFLEYIPEEIFDRLGFTEDHFISAINSYKAYPSYEIAMMVLVIALGAPI